MPEKFGNIMFRGMDRDMSPQDPNRNMWYYDAQNITLIFNGNLSRSVIRSEKGNKLLCKLPNIHFSSVAPSPLPWVWANVPDGTIFTEDTSKTTYPSANGSVITNDGDSAFITYNQVITELNAGRTGNILQWSLHGDPFPNNFWGAGTYTIRSGNQIILGGGYLKDKLIIIATEETYNSLIVWEITYDRNFDPTITLRFFAPNMNMDDGNLVTKLRGIYKAPDIQKVYWTDGRNQLRTVEITRKEPFFQAGKTIDATPEWNQNTPNILSVTVTGGKWSRGAGVAQYGYRLFTKNGPVTKMSTLSSLVPITKGYRGVPNGDEGTSIINVELGPIDQDYPYAQVYRFFHDDAGNTVCHLIYEGASTSDGDYLYVRDYGDATQKAQITDIDGLLTTPTGPYIPQTFEFKDNRVFIGNLTSSTLDVDVWDARAYSFSKTGASPSRTARLFKEDLTTVEVDIDGAAPSWPDIDTEYNGSNISNTALPDTTYHDFYVRQSDGATLGAEGPNVTISWYTERSNHGSGSSFRNPAFYGYASYKTDDVYRFGIEFFDKYGNSLFVKWIADIRVPRHAKLGGHLGLDDEQEAFNNSGILRVYPQFDLDNLDLLDDDIRYFRIVRAPRTESDRIIKTQGLVNASIFSFSGRDFSYYGQAYMPMYVQRFYNPTPPSRGDFYPRNVGGETYGLSASSVSEISAGEGQYDVADALVMLYSPEVVFGQPLEVDGDEFYINIVQGATASLNAGGSAGYRPDADTGEAFDELLGWYSVLSKDSDWTTAGGGTRSGIEQAFWYSYQTTWRTDIVAQSGATSDSLLVPVRNAKTVAGGSTKHAIGDYTFINFITLYGSRNNTGSPTWGVRYFPEACTVFTLNGFALNGSMTAREGDVLQNRDQYPIADWYDSSVTPFGGTSISSRQSQQWIPCTSLQEITGASVTGVIARQGDVFPQPFKYLLIDYYETDTAPLRDPDIYTSTTEHGALSTYDGTLQSAKTFVEIPVETYLNLQFVDDRWDNDLHKTATSTRDLKPNYNPVYNKENDYLKSFTKPALVDFQARDTIVTRYSDADLTGTFVDELCQFRPNNAGNVDARFGDITTFHIFQEHLYVIQEYGAGMWLVQPLAQTGSTAGTIALGTGAVLADYVILSDTYGSTFKHGSTVGERGVYFFDGAKKKLVRLARGEEPFSDIKGAHAYLQELPKDIPDDLYNEGTGVMMGYDHITHNVYLNIFYEGDDTFGEIDDVLEV